MKRSIEDTPIVFIGAGNLATNLAKALYRKGFRIVVRKIRPAGWQKKWKRNLLFIRKI
jgi:3-hydroxyisobutyrate dehydrogenase-like beta-hydroxyacid dehydrogenase